MNQRSAILSQQFPLAIRMLKTEMIVILVNQRVAGYGRCEGERMKSDMMMQAKNKWRKRKIQKETKKKGLIELRIEKRERDMCYTAADGLVSQVTCPTAFSQAAKSNLKREETNKTPYTMSISICYDVINLVSRGPNTNHDVEEHRHVCLSSRPRVCDLKYNKVAASRR
ncbi:hypothetical protein BDV33DRAFT_134841 [Aspergillus novoparasiticus]|uniref:Uncharacterized protein n=1 Tax=Aspergillus novoparasiticus TaxID=986946 RepID=A0A5N6F537_9EURO|nr:hypothetical protein BDV33DRAFT_134841 [Aspergillus novoparasiticus]